MIERKGRKVAAVPHPWLNAALAVGMPGALSMADPGYVCTAAEPLPIPSWDDLAAERATDRDRARRDRARLIAAGVCYSCRREPATNGGICRPCLAAKRERSAERKVRRAGLCYWCPAPALPGRRMCRACADLAREKSRQVRAERIAAGRCSRCGGPGGGCKCRGPAPRRPRRPAPCSVWAQPAGRRTSSLSGAPAKTRRPTAAPLLIHQGRRTLPPRGHASRVDTARVYDYYPGDCAR